MWRAEPASEATRVSRYWNDLVTGHPGKRIDADLDQSLVQTIAWLERNDDAQPASAEFSRRFELQFLQTVGADAAPDRRQAGKLIAFPDHRGRQQGSHRGLPRPGRENGAWRLLLTSAAAAVLLIVSLVAIYYIYERHEGSREPNVILAPSSAVDVPMDRGNPARNGIMPGPGITDDLAIRWSFEAGSGAISAPAVVSDTVFVTGAPDPGVASSELGSIIAIDASTGSERWRFPTGRATGATPAVAGGIVYAGDASGIVYALDASTGEERWRKELQSGWTSEPVVVGDEIYIAASAYQAPLHLAIHDGVVVVGSGYAGRPEDGVRLYAFDRLTGEEQWHAADERSGQPGLFAFDAENGAPAWQFAMPSFESGPAIAGGKVYVGSTLGPAIYALDLASGEIAWQTEIGEGLPLNSSPAVSGENVLVTTDSGTIVCLDQSTGEVRWQASAEHASLKSSAVMVGSTIYVVDTAFGVSALSAHDGTVLWSQQLELTGQAVVSPVVVNGTLFIGTSLEGGNSSLAATLWAISGSGGS